MKSLRWPILFLCLALLPAFVVHLVTYTPSEPFFNGDETRHLTTGVFFRDFIVSGEWLHPKRYATDYYLQYPALGLLVWPPGLHVSEGAWFLLFGDSFAAGRALVFGSFLFASFNLYRLAKRTHGTGTAMAATALFSLMPIVVQFSTRVMAEIPCLAWVLACVFHFERYMGEKKRTDAWLACLFAAFAALTRFDAILLLPYLGGRLLMTRNFALLKRGPVLGGVALALFLTVPYYAMTFKEGYGSAIATTAAHGTSAGATSFLAWQNFLYYPSYLPSQMSWFVLMPALLGLLVSWLPSRRTASGPYHMMILATYMTFTPMAEMDERHAIYWLPAFAVLAADGFRFFCSCMPTLMMRAQAIVLGGLLLFGGLIATTVLRPYHYVFGYREAAEYVVAHSKERPVILIDAFLNGGFIYDTRRADPQRRFTVLRGDKLFYGMLSDPHGGYAEHVKGPEDILKMIHEYDPEYIVVEQPLIYFDMQGAKWFREAIASKPERFVLEKTIDIRSNRKIFENAKLEIYRNTVRNPNAANDVRIPMLSLGKTLGK